MRTLLLLDAPSLFARVARFTSLFSSLVLGLAFQFPSTAAFAGGVIKLNGYAEWRYEEFLIVAGQRVKAGKSTRFTGKGAARGLDAIPLGYEVKIHGTRTPDGTILARKVEAKPNGSALFEGQLRSAFDETEERWRRDGRAFEQGQNLGKLLRSGRDVERVHTIIDRLVPPYRRTSEFRAYVIENSAWNAMAAPNGSVFVFTGLLDGMDDDELAIILGHELVHTTYEHSRRQFKRSLWTKLGLASVLAVTEGASSRAANECERPGGRSDVGPSLLSTGAALGALAFTNRYSRQHEDQADRVGLRYAYEAGYDVSKAPELWRKFGRKHGGQPEALNFLLSSHSTASARARKLRIELDRNYR